ncbi:mechanosensitive ion channel family protein [Thermocoleostomius sinensis]|uniref:Mechanosensitive ion channel family protein n=1 Tax=Thermocoleostomius sinensis A174 TaxID=2016057 RepID=A0A9E8ZIE2_9CYAN|nr:mechanosensitive ion channel family protein [Thermocoleostomius sinensis]WAL61838.1 mechanosensitive ion channel family protein [Thermocoleostomius sinensis A174]
MPLPSSLIQLTQRLYQQSFRSFFQFRRWRWMGLAIGCLVWVSGFSGLAPAAWGQLSLPDSSVPTPGLPPRVERLGSLETAPVRFENRDLFRVTAVTVPDRANPEGQILVEARAAQIEANLRQVLTKDPTWNLDSGREYFTLYDPDTLRVDVATLNGQTVLTVTDAYRLQPLELLTVTPLDARYYGLTVEELAQQWQQLLQQRLTRALEARKPDVITQQLQQAIRVAVGVLVISALLLLLQKLFTVRSRALKRQLAVETAKSRTQTQSSEPASRATHRLDFITAIQQQFPIEKRLAIVSLLRWLLFWGQVSVWFVGISWILHIFSSTEALAENLLRLPIALLLVWFVLGLVNRLGDILITRVSRAWQNNDLFTFEDAQRRSLRISTILRSTKGFKTFVLYALGIGGLLSYVGVPIGSVLTLGAVVALAVSLASQSLIKDLVNGFLILCEDQYAIGDWIAVGTVDGLVENMNLRITQIRTVEGRLITIPNSLISQVENLTRNWSRTDFMITVAYNTDIKLALDVIKQVAHAMYDDPKWQPHLLKPPEVVGVESISHEGQTIRVWIDTQPLQQWRAGREFRLRVRIALEESNIDIGMPQQVIWHRQQNDRNSSSEADVWTPASHTESVNGKELKENAQ